VSVATLDDDFADYVAARWLALVRYATVLCGDPVEAEELVQSALVRVAMRWHRIRDVDNPEPYVRQAVLRGFLNTWRRIRSRETGIDAMPVTMPMATAADHASGVVDSVVVRRALLTLPPRQRAVLVLRYLDDLSEAQTADMLGCSVGTVKSQASKGLTRLRAVLAVDEDGADDQDVAVNGGRR
jgi:RNA polymerase sigma-70 factor (sigma-E family)